MLRLVTMTGADDSVTVQDLVNISQQYPFVEWGILFSAKRTGSPRYPSYTWVRHLVKNNPGLKLSAHLCGALVRDFVAGGDKCIEELKEFWDIFQRVQINFHSIPHTLTEGMITNMERLPGKEFIFQYDGVNDAAVRKSITHGQNATVLFDKSGGAGILPGEWPNMLDDITCGYAGGLGPHNLAEQIRIISDKVGARNSWIDMETHVRSEFDARFDLEKVKACLEISKPYIHG